MSDSLCGLWIDDAGKVHSCRSTADGGRSEAVEDFKPFAWLGAAVTYPGVTLEALKGEGTFRWLVHAESLPVFGEFFKTVKEGGLVDVLRPYESQWLLQRRARLFGDLHFRDLRRCQLNIETGATEADTVSDPRKADDRVLAIGLQCGELREVLLLDEISDAGEKRLLIAFTEKLRALDPDVIEGHNIFKFDLDYLRQRHRRYRLPCAWGRFGLPAEFRNGRMKVAERWVDFTRCDIPGRSVIDTYLLVQLYDITARELTAYELKDVAVYFGISPDTTEVRPDSQHMQGIFTGDRAAFLASVTDELRESKGMADVLLPTYFEQARAFPILLQEAALRGTAGKVDLLFLEEYYHARACCPEPVEIATFEGGFTRSFQEGVFRHVLHFDVASLYPSLLLQMNRNPKSDTLGVFIPLLRQLREYRLKYKQLAKTAPTLAERDEAQARQSTFKILINSFYGYLGFSGARFGDGELAAEVTRRGRELLQALIEEFQKHECTVLEADTDGIYLSAEKYFARPEDLLAKVSSILPPGIELEHDGAYDAMFCYKAKNYALAANGEITLRGSALRSRGIEPFLKRLSDQLIAYLLGVSRVSPLGEIEQLRAKIAAREQPVADLAKSETLSQNPAAYEQLIAGGGKPRRASAEVALAMKPRPRMGERVSYYIGPKGRGQTTDWQRARPLADHHPVDAPYAPEYYLVKIDDWLKRYEHFLGIQPLSIQEEMKL